jgi:hypothetical protein
LQPRRVLGGQLRVSEAGYLHCGERGRKAGEAAMAFIGEKFTEMFLGKENVNPRDKDLLFSQACQMAMEGDQAQAQAQAKAVEAKAKKVKNKKEKAKRDKKEGKCKKL